MKKPKLLLSNSLGQLWHGDVLKCYDQWPSPVAIISDGPYGIDGYRGDTKTPSSLAEIYEPHIKKWSEKATPETTLWFWNTEVGWASVHPVLERHGWIYRGLNIWDKGIDHIAGNCNGKTMRKFPTVTEVCAHYVRKEIFKLASGQETSIQNWLISEWKRTGLTLAKANEACGVKNAASRKYLTKDHLWYFPPADVFKKLVDYANTHGDIAHKPYFTIDGKTTLSSNQWERMRSKFNFEYGATNVWTTPALRSKERLKDGTLVSHPNQKPLVLMNRIINASTDTGDLIWEPFGGTASASVAAEKTGRLYRTCEIDKDYLKSTIARLKESE